MKILHGMCQGNGAAPAAWLVLSTVLIRIYNRRGHGACLRTPTMRCLLDQMGVCFVDDTDLFIFKSCLQTECELFTEAQSSLRTWGSTLIGTGGILKPEKCHYYKWDFECHNGNWEYVNLRDYPYLEVPTPAGVEVPIEQMPVTSSKKTLGLYTNPAGCCAKQVDILCDDVQS